MRRAFLFLVLLLPLSVTRAAGDTITITNGFLDAAGLEVVSPPSTVTGTDGFSLAARVAVGVGAGLLGPLSVCNTSLACQPGVQLNAGGHLASFGGGLVDGELSLRGVDYDLSGIGAALTLSPSGMFTLPEFGSSTAVTIMTPFMLTGSFSTLLGNPVFDQIAGQGTATIRLVRDSEFATWRGEGVRFDFEPAAAVPEPASLLLLGTGLAGLVYRKRFRNARASNRPSGVS